MGVIHNLSSNFSQAIRPHKYRGPWNTEGFDTSYVMIFAILQRALCELPRKHRLSLSAVMANGEKCTPAMKTFSALCRTTAFDRWHVNNRQLPATHLINGLFDNALNLVVGNTQYRRGIGHRLMECFAL